ncbi:hypothetical protein DA69_04175 [Brevundimonas naejangsanensis]|uniref:Uncharacterized protein n=1 Tax=Brevundimonas naejangsanensis TaxID=588932 RepID=A0A172Y476_9CAUL|nr:hypothetical protein DA69_04175 [Brevundimonas naejangsanensis]
MLDDAVRGYAAKSGVDQRPSRRAVAVGFQGLIPTVDRPRDDGRNADAVAFREEAQDPRQNKGEETVFLQGLAGRQGRQPAAGQSGRLKAVGKRLEDRVVVQIQVRTMKAAAWIGEADHRLHVGLLSPE